MTPTRQLTACLLAAAVALGACGDDDADRAEAGTTSTTVEATTTTTTAEETTTTGADAAAGGSIAEVATAAGATFVPGYTEFAPGFEAALDGDGPITVLMPSDDAFIAFNSAHPDLTNRMREDLDALDDLLLYHVIDAEQLEEAIAGSSELATLQGEPITVEVVDGATVLNGGQATIVEADLPADNGVVHVLDGILLPPSIAAEAG